MIFLRELVAVSAGAVVVLVCGASATAQEVTSLNGSLDRTIAAPSVIPNFQKKNLQERFNSEHLVVEIAQMNNEESPSEKPQSTSIGEKDASLEPLNPSANPLVFPTKPEDVEIKNEVPITLKQAIELAQRNNKNLQTARLTLERSKADLRAALAEEYPTISTQVDLSRDSSTSAELQNEQIRQQGLRNTIVNALTQLGVPANLIEQILQSGLTASVIEQLRQLGVTDAIINILRQLGLPISEIPEESTNINGSIQLDYNLYTGGRRGAQIRLAEEQVRIDELNVEIASAEATFNTTRDYYSLQNADSQVEIEQGAINDASRSLRDVELLRREGLATRLDLLQAEAELANANQRQVLAIAQQRTARRQLAETLGVGMQVGLTAADPIETAGSWDMSLEESIVLAIKNRAELEQQLLQREIGEQQRQIELAAIKPQVGLFANYNFTDNFEDNLSVADGYSLGGRLQWNLYDGGRAFARADGAIKQKEIAETAFAQRRDLIRLDVESAYFDLTANQENIQTAQKNGERATERLRLARLRFQAGVGTQTEVIDAQRDLTDARGNYLQAIIGYNQSLNQLQRAISNLPDNRLFEKP